jgi:DNA replication protein DnaC
MQKIDKAILNIDKLLCSNIDKFDDTERGVLSQNMLAHLRDFVEHISLKVFSNGEDIEINYENIQLGNSHVARIGKLKFLKKFHKLLQKSTSHYTFDEENSERLMLKYYEYLLKIKSFLKKQYDLEVLGNISRFPINTDKALSEYYEKIAEKINQPVSKRSKIPSGDRYYIQKIKPFFVGYEVYYEVTFTRASNNISKFDRIIAFTRFDIPPNYAVKLSISSDNISVLDKSMPIQIIDNWDISIRPCELNNFAKIFGKDLKMRGNSPESRELMSLLKRSGLNLSEIMNLPDSNYEGFKNALKMKVKTTHFLDVLDECRNLIKNKKPGHNIIVYLLYRLDNKIIKKQYNPISCAKLSDLHLEYGCIPFEEMPFNTSLKNHNPKILDLFDSIDSSDRDHELLARFVKNKTESNGCLYTSKEELSHFDNTDELIQKYNNSLYFSHGNRKLDSYKDHVYIRGYENDVLSIISQLKDLSIEGFKDYSKSVNAWLSFSDYDIDCDQKKFFMEQMFEDSRVALIYGAAGTGKSTLINHISNFFNDDRKLYLANTNPAVDNLRRKVKASNCDFKTIAKFLARSNQDREFDLIVIDECSTVSNSDMRKILEKASFLSLVLVGDIFQIESILFGNWFSVIRPFVPPHSVFELTKPYRTTNKNLLELWDKVRNIEDDIVEHITKNNYSARLDESIFDYTQDDEIILCLNYDGLYGINNINRFLQSNNQSKSVRWGIQTYKVNDPVLFNETERFSPLIYNNLKGRIIDVVSSDDQIQFDIEIDKVINGMDVYGYDFDLLDSESEHTSLIRFVVNKHKSTDEDDDSADTVIPFQVAYAVSIHKAQGLEYNSVKIVITTETEELITHNIFYTAITRARENLKIYWTPEAGQKILESLETKNNNKDIALIKAKNDL